MSNLIRWEPAREMMTLREAMDHLFDDAFTRPLGRLGDNSMPAIDMYQTDSEVVVKAAIPGYKAGDVQINVTGELLNLRGEMHQVDEKDDKSWQIREQRYGSFERNVMLPVPVRTDKANAEFEDGILTITLPKADEARSRTITVKTKKA